MNDNTPARILVVDDSEFMRNFTCDALQAAGYAAEVAGDAWIAPIVNRFRPDLILMDVVLSTHRGNVLIEVLRKLEHAEARLVVAAERRVGVALGADCHSPIAVYATTAGERITILARVIATDGSRMLEDRIEGAAVDGESLGATLADRLLSAGAGEILAAAESATA